MSFFQLLSAVGLASLIIAIPVLISLRREKRIRQHARQAWTEQCSGAPVSLKEPLRLEYQFSTREKTDIDVVNQDLSQYLFSTLDVDADCYMATRTTSGSTDKERWLGFVSLNLTCQPPTEEERHRYQIDTFAVENTVSDGLEQWRSRHPDRIVRICVQYGYQDALGFVVAHHERDEG